MQLCIFERPDKQTPGGMAKATTSYANQRWFVHCLFCHDFGIMFRERDIRSFPAPDELADITDFVNPFVLAAVVEVNGKKYLRFLGVTDEQYLNLPKAEDTALAA